MVRDRRIDVRLCLGDLEALRELAGEFGGISQWVVAMIRREKANKFAVRKQGTPKGEIFFQDILED